MMRYAQSLQEIREAPTALVAPEVSGDLQSQQGTDKCVGNQVSTRLHQLEKQLFHTKQVRHNSAQTAMHVHYGRRT